MNQNDIDQAEAIMQAVARVVKDATAAMASENAELRREVAALKTALDALADSHAATASTVKEIADRPAPEVPAPVEIDLSGFATVEFINQMREPIALEIDRLSGTLKAVLEDHESRERIVAGNAEKLETALAELPVAVKSAVDQAVAALPPIEIPKLPEVRDGRDAVQIDILPAIDTAKSYPRGSYARHAGGVWKAYRDTDGMHGWECVLRGVKSLAVAMADERTLTVTTELSDGEPTAQTISIPTVLDRGPHVEGKIYEPGDAVTYGGSLWIAQKSAPTGRPGDEGSEGWRLAVRRGRDAAKQPVKV